MPYIGKEPVIGNFVKLDAISVVNGQAAYTMNNGGSAFTAYNNVNQFLVSLNGVLQAPTDSFSVSGSTLTFVSNLVTGDVIDFVIVLGNTLDIGTPSDNTVTNAKIVNSTIELAKLSATGVKDATTFLRGDNTFAIAGGDNTPAFAVTNSANQTISDVTYTLVTFDTEILDTDTAFASNTFTVPAGEGGYYNIFSQINLESVNLNRITEIKIAFYLNGSIDAYSYLKESQTLWQDTITLHKIYNLSAADTLKVYLYVDDSDNAGSRVLGGSNYNTIFGGYKLIT